MNQGIGLTEEVPLYGERRSSYKLLTLITSVHKHPVSSKASDVDVSRAMLSLLVLGRLRWREGEHTHMPVK